MKIYERNGKNKENSLPMTILKTQSTEPQQNKLGITNTKEWTKINPCGSEVKVKLPNLNINNSIKMSLKTPVTHWLGPISKPKEMSNLMV